METKINTRILSGLVLISLVVLLCGCIKEGEVTTPSSSPQILIVGEMWKIDSIDPAKGGTILKEKALVIETLVEAKPNFELKPGLAESWEQLSETKWKFNLRTGVKFHDGTPFNAEAVKFSLDRARTLNPSVQTLTEIKNIDVIDDHTIVITLNKPYSPFLATLSYPDTAIISPASVNERGELIRPIGTGAFKLEDWDQATGTLTLVRNDEYWRNPIRLEKMIIKPIHDPSTRSIALEKGEIDFTCDPPYGDIERLKNMPGINVELHNTARIYRMEFGNIQNSPYSDIKVRKAINYAIDREKIVEHVLHGCGEPATGPFMPGIVWTNSNIEGYPYNPERAKQLLMEAGWRDSDGDGIIEKNGEKFKATIFTYPQRSGLQPMAEAIQAQLREVGIDVEVRVMEWGAISERRKEKAGGDMFLSAYATAMVPDPDYYLRVAYHSKGGYNPEGYENELVDELLERGSTIYNITERYEIYNKVQEIVVDESPECIIAYYGVAVTIRDHVKGFVFNPTAHDYMIDPNMYIAKK